ncbi:hypothetical protein AAGV33_05315 [Flavobacterium sp. FBOR7N2.3]|uniref:DUF4843 domain-containing protein n=1 Tax=Flavobacterium magnesitis TaxID=3138077 RepID=A0ABV4TLI9_9FLAO
MKKYLNRLIGFVLLIGCSFSCSSDLDFDQANDLKLKPTFVGNFSYFDAPATAFVANDGSEYDLAFDNQDFDVFRDKYLNDYLQRADFYFEINNTINRAYTLTIILMTENDEALTTIRFNVPAYSGTPNTITRTEIFENARLDLLKSTRKMGFQIAMAPGPALDKNSTGNLILRSNATAYLEIQ